jgi:hypothetical protein
MPLRSPLPICLRHDRTGGLDVAAYFTATVSPAVLEKLPASMISS